MKLAIRDDDLNFFFNPAKIEENYKEIWKICPVSMSVVPFIKGNWPQNVKEYDKYGPGFMDKATLSKIQSDNTVYPINENTQLVSFIKQKIASEEIYLTIHAIYHRNEDMTVPQIHSNFGIGAEFFTNRDLTEPLANAITYLEQTFGQIIEVFTPPQNLVSLLGLKAINHNRLAICGDLPSLKSLKSLKILGSIEYIKHLIFRIRNYDIIYPFPIINRSIRLIGHYRLQHSTNLEMLYAAFEESYKLNGTFVISTHSYGFDNKMKNSNKSLGLILNEFIQFAAQKNNIQFVNLKQIFDK